MSTCLMGQMSSCFILHDTVTDAQARLLYELGPNSYYINWLDIIELSDLRAKMVLQYDAKCVKDLTCVDLSPSKMSGKFSGSVMACENFKESLNAVGSIQVFFPLLNYLATNTEYGELIANEWFSNAKVNTQNATSPFQNLAALRKSSFDGNRMLF
jgi:hypothetical protein